MRRIAQVLLAVVVVAALTGCMPKLTINNVNTFHDDGTVSGKVDVTVSAEEESGKNVVIKKEKVEIFMRPEQTLGLEPTEAVIQGNISTYLVVFSKRLLGGEYFLGTLRWDGWVWGDDNVESFAQVLFSGVHPSGNYFGTAVLDGKVRSGKLIFFSSDMQFIYSPFGKELAIDKEKFGEDPVYRHEKIQEVNKTEEGEDFNISSLSEVRGFQDVIKSWNQILLPEGYLISPYGVEEIALIRGQNPQYSYFQKLIGTGRFAIRLGINPVGMAIVNAAGIAMDLIRAANAPSKGRDFSSVVNRRVQSFANEYLLALAEAEMKKRNSFNAKLLSNQNKNERSSP
jgi:hypothetical protein